MARGRGDPKPIRSSLAILHERFEVLQREKKRRERKELMMYFPDPVANHFNGTFFDGPVPRDQTELSVQHQRDYHPCLARQRWKSLEGCFLTSETSSRRDQGEFGGGEFLEMPLANKRPRCSDCQPVTQSAPGHSDVLDTTLHL
ncbi:hypothetical protein MLD38_019927 [Melastoma candidum]|uniref:Uncharacterized protein n=1 Tax=Melastoma candidum TaxID=119954 RepID=A0ACB9QAY4_9MYRT|nr:hypothetical protein MLD38_019927 [Melastoma candidum]